MSYFVTGLVCFLLGGAFVIATEEWFDYDTIVTSIFAGVALVILFLPLTIYNIFFKLTLAHPPTQEQVDKCLSVCGSEKHYHVFGKVFLHIDPQATKMWNKAFFLRVK